MYKCNIIVGKRYMVRTYAARPVEVRLVSIEVRPRARGRKASVVYVCRRIKNDKVLIVNSNKRFIECLTRSEK